MPPQAKQGYKVNVYPVEIFKVVDHLKQIHQLYLEVNIIRIYVTHTFNIIYCHQNLPNAPPRY